MFGLGAQELIIILIIVLVIFGAGKLPQVGGALGKGLKNFKEGMTEEEETPGAEEAPAKTEAAEPKKPEEILAPEYEPDADEEMAGSEQEETADEAEEEPPWPVPEEDEDDEDEDDRNGDPDEKPHLN